MADSENRSYDFEQGVSRLYVGYPDVLSIARELAGRVPAEEYDFVIGVANGGLSVAQIVFDEIRERNPSLGIGSVQVKRYKGLEGGAPEFPYFPKEILAGKRLLVADELVDEGGTFLALSDKFRSIGAKADYLALYGKEGREFSPTFLGREIPKKIGYMGREFENWLVFPWEKEWLAQPEKGYMSVRG